MCMRLHNWGNSTAIRCSRFRAYSQKVGVGRDLKVAERKPFFGARDSLDLEHVCNTLKVGTRNLLSTQRRSSQCTLVKITGISTRDLECISLLFGSFDLSMANRSTWTFRVSGDTARSILINELRPLITATDLSADLFIGAGILISGQVVRQTDL